MPRELLIRGGLLVDGTGAPARRSDLRLADGQITEMGADLSAAGADVLDAGGCLVAPGFIDMHSHSDLSVITAPDLECAQRQGITTLVVGNCGLTAFPLAEAYQSELRSYLQPFVPGAAYLSWSWHDLDGYFAEVTSAGLGANLVPLVGQGSVRLAVRGFSPGAVPESELAAMVRLLEESLRQGAAGLSFGLLYPPGSYASHDELLCLARSTAAADRLLTVHIRNEGDGLGDAVEEALAIGRAARVRLQLSHQKAVGRANWGRVRATLQALAEARASGVDVAFDVWPYTSGSTTITALLPAWVLEGGIEAALQCLQATEVRARLRCEVEQGIMAGEALIQAVGFEGIAIAECPDRPELAGRSLTEIFAARGSKGDSWTMFFDFLVEIGLRATMIIRDELDEDDVRTLLRDPWCCLGSDSWATTPQNGGKPHPRAYGTVARFLRRYVLDEQLMTLEEGIRRLTSLPASRLGLEDRGRLALGTTADIVIADPDAIRERGSFADPHQFAEGVRHLLANGRIVLRNGLATGSRPGRLLRGGAKG